MVVEDGMDDPLHPSQQISPYFSAAGNEEVPKRWSHQVIMYTEGWLFSER